ncbi:MAG: acyl-CoA thioesterase [Planctomycetes bacterium]|nr:acyl-CoA thioesterase [Planctomycetota bacterium]
MRELVLPNDTNTHGNILGGKVLHLIDIAAAMCAMRHCRKPVVTASIDEVQFLNPIPEGHFVELKASVNYVGRTSMEIGVKVMSEDPMTGEILHTSSAYLTFVALTKSKTPSEVPDLELTSEIEKARYERGRQRMEARKAHRVRE